MNLAFIFDVDGTLLDGTEGIIKSVEFAISEMKLPKLTQDELLTFVGPPIQNSVKQRYGLNDEEAQRFANIFRGKYAEGNVFLARVYDGIYDLLDYLKQKQCKLGVATYKREDYAVDLMKHFKFDRYFEAICGADNENKLTKFDILVNCKNAISSDNNNTIMVGDSFHDAEAAEKLGVKFIGVTYGFGFKSEKDVNEYPNIFSADTPYEITEFLKTYN